MNFMELLICAKAGDNKAAERILTMYQPMLLPLLHRGLPQSDFAYRQRISVSIDSFLRGSR